LNDTRPIEADDKWANVARNLSQQPEKEIALAALDRAIKVSRGALRQFPQTMHIAEQRRQRGEPPSHAHEAIAERHAQAEMQPFLERLGECQSARKRDPLSACNRDPSFCVTGTSVRTGSGLLLGRSCG